MEKIRPEHSGLHVLADRLRAEHPHLSDDINKILLLLESGTMEVEEAMIILKRLEVTKVAGRLLNLKVREGYDERLGGLAE